MTHEPGDLPFAVVTRPDGVRRSIRDLPKDDDRADRVSGRHVVTKAKAHGAHAGLFAGSFVDVQIGEPSRASRFITKCKSLGYGRASYGVGGRNRA